MLYATILTIHLLSVIIYGGFLITDVLFITNIKKVYGEAKYKEIRGAFGPYVRAIVPNALVLAGITGIYLFHVNFGTIDVDEDGSYILSNFQELLLLKLFLASWLLLRGIRQRFFGIQPMLFKGHKLPASLVIIIVILAKFMKAV